MHLTLITLSACWITQCLATSLLRKRHIWMEWLRIVEVYFHMLMAKDELFLLRTKHGRRGD